MSINFLQIILKWSITLILQYVQKNLPHIVNTVALFFDSIEDHYNKWTSDIPNDDAPSNDFQETFILIPLTEIGIGPIPLRSFL